MKKRNIFFRFLFIILITILFLFSIYACGGGEASYEVQPLSLDGSEEEPAAAAPEPAETMMAMEATAAEEAPAIGVPDSGDAPANEGDNNSGGGNASLTSTPMMLPATGGGDSSIPTVILPEVLLPATQNPDNVDVRGSKSDGTPEDATASPVFTQAVEITATPSNNSNIPAPTDFLSGGGFVDLPPYIPEQRRLTLEYPPSMKAGAESDLVILTLEVDDQGNITPTVEFQGNRVQSEVVPVPILYDSYYVIAEAQFNMAGMTIDPPGAIFEPLHSGQPLRFTWSILPQNTGRYTGTVSLHLNFENKSNGDKSRLTIFSRPIEIRAVDFFGLSVNFTRTSGVLGSIVGTVLGIPFFDDIVKFLFKRRRKARR